MLPAQVEETLCKIARDEALALCVGFAEKREEALGFWNTALLIDALGEVKLRYRKHHLWGNEANLGICRSDDDLAVVQLDLPGPPACRIRTSMLICYDVEFPEMVRVLALPPKNVQLLLVPTAMPYTEPNSAIKMVPARAMENRIFIAYCNYPCLPRVDGEYFCGHSNIVAPNADFSAGPCDWAFDGLLFGKIGWNDTLTWLATETPYLSDRRAQFYASQGLCQAGDEELQHND
jgi:predicted amidohydrolase